MTDESHAGPVFVMGSMGSGTTITRLMLDTHPNLMIARETGFMRALMANYHIPFWQFGDVWLDRIDMTEAELDEAVRRFYDDVFGKAAAKQGARRWGDKTPFHVHHMKRAARIFPDAQFVATVRHPGAVANSMKRFGWNWKAGIRTWLNSNQAMVDSGIELGDRFFLIRYEDLVSDTRAVMEEVLAFLGEPWDDRVLSHHEQQSGRAEGGTRAEEPVDTARIARWADSASQVQMRRLNTRTAGLAPLFGYQPTDPLPAAPLSDKTDAIGMTGVQLGQKYEELSPPRVDYRPAFENRLYTQLSMAEELEQANLAGRDLRPIRQPYQALIDQLDTPSRTMPARIRRRVSRIINPDS